MKKFLFLALTAFVLFSGPLFAQHSTEENIKSSLVQISAGSGIYSGGFPIYAFADFRVQPNWTVGPQVNFVFDNNFHFVLSGRADYHFNSLLNLYKNWDLYAGATMGIDFSKDTEFSSGIHVGGRWYWNKTWGLNVEIGGGTYFKSSIGVTLRL